MFEITFVLEILAMLTGLILYKKIKPVIYKLMIVLLVITVWNEGSSYYGLHDLLQLNKKASYNLFFLVEFVIIAIIYSTAANNSPVFIAFNVVVFLTAISLLIVSGLYQISPDYVSLICGSLILSGFYQLYKTYINGDLSNLREDPLLYFTIGLIVAQFFLLFYINAKRIDSFREDKSWLTVFRALTTVGNIIYYLLISYSFICTSIYRRRAGTS